MIGKVLLLFVGVSLLATHSVALPPECGQVQPPSVPPLTATGYVIRQVNVLFRHGDRQMYSDDPCWPNDEGVFQCGLTHTSIPSENRNQTELSTGYLFRKNYMEGRNYYPGNCETGQLTNKGYQQEQDTGRMYRSLYVDSYGLLPATFDPSTTYIRSDSEDRCVQSLEALFSGFYGPETHSAWSVYNIDTMDTAYDDIAPNSQLCPLYGEYLDEYMQTPAYQEHYNNYTAKLYQTLGEAIGFPVESWSTFSHVHDCLTVHTCREQPIPSGVTQELFSAVNAEFAYTYWMQYHYPTAQLNAQAGIGFLLREMVGKMDNMVASNSTEKLTLWSGHDTSVIPMLNALGLWRGAWAPYASQLVFEIWEGSAQQFYVRIIYNGKVVSGDFSTATCDRATGLCPYDDFRSYAESLFPVEGACDPIDPFWAARKSHFTKFGYHMQR